MEEKDVQSSAREFLKNCRVVKSNNTEFPILDGDDLGRFLSPIMGSIIFVVGCEVIGTERTGDSNHTDE